MASAAATMAAPEPDVLMGTQHANPVGPGQRPVFTVPVQRLVCMQVPRLLSQGMPVQHWMLDAPEQYPGWEVPPLLLQIVVLRQAPLPTLGTEQISEFAIVDASARMSVTK